VDLPLLTQMSEWPGASRFAGISELGSDSYFEQDAKSKWSY